MGNKIARAVVFHQMRTAVNPRLRVLPGRQAPAEPPQPSRENPLALIDNPDDFRRIFVPHLDAAYNLARWLLRNDSDAQDVVQDAYVRALRFSRTFRGGDARAWILTIVRNAAYTWMKRNRPVDSPASFDEEQHSEAGEAIPVDIELIRKADAQVLRDALDELPTEFREMIVLRDLEELSYKEIAAVADVPIGTVMSRLARARQRLKSALLKRVSPGGGR
ncbi:MAG: sigma-70 family RNA polymerase sigma factor [Candidatus Binataceae bacterium]